MVKIQVVDNSNGTRVNKYLSRVPNLYEYIFIDTKEFEVIGVTHLEIGEDSDSHNAIIKVRALNVDVEEI